jgi:hypothetical protein
MVRSPALGAAGHRGENMLDDEDPTARARRELDEYLAPLYLEEELSKPKRDKLGRWLKGSCGNKQGRPRKVAAVPR